VIRYCSICRCERMHTAEGDCVVCIRLFNDAIRKAEVERGEGQS